METTFFYAAFLGQIVLISFFLPRNILSRMRAVLRAHPPDEYPKLYPMPLEYYEERLRRFRNLNVVALVVGVALLATVMVIPHETKWNAAIATGFFFFQFVPVAYLEFTSCSQFRIMRLIAAKRTRKAELQRRRFLDFVSPAAAVGTVLIYVAFVALVLYVASFDLPWFTAGGNIAGVTALYVLFGGVVLHALYGKKPDPHQSHEDRRRSIQVKVSVAVYSSIIATTFLALTLVLAVLERRDLQPMALCIYFSVLAVISFRGLEIDETNFDVYREEPAT